MEGFRKNLKRFLVYGGAILASFVLFSTTARAATLFLAPSSGTYTVGNNFSVVVKVNSGGVPINAAEGTIVFNPNELSIVSLSKSGSVFNLWVQEPDFSNALGTVNFGGIVFNPGYTGASGTLLTVTFKAKAVGSTQLVFSSGAVLANDGLGTNILSAMSGGSYSLKTSSTVPQMAPGASAAPSAPSGGIAAAPVIKSPTHPDQSKWYSNKNPFFKWALPPDISEVRLVLSKKPSSVPQVIYVPPISEKALTDLEDGVWYLHGQFRTSAGLGPVVSFKFQIDTQAPNSFEITRVDTNDPTNPQPELLFESSDSTSGIDRYEMKIGEGDWFSIEPDLAGRPYKLPLQAPGTREITVKAFDRAGNSTTTTTTTTTTTGIKPPVIESAPARVKKGDPLVVGGSALLRVKVVLEVLRGGGKFAAVISGVSQIAGKLEGVADDNGRWEVMTTDLPSGEFWARAYAVDGRGAISDFSKPVYFKVISPIFENALRFPLKGFDFVLNFLVGKWPFVILGILVWSFIYILVKNIFPYIGREFRKIAFICRTYRLNGKIGKGSKKLQVELKMVQSDIKKELDLLEKIGRHRGFRSDEKYTKKKLEKYLGLLKSLK